MLQVQRCVEVFGSLDIFWANAGVIGSTDLPVGTNRLTGITADSWRRTLAVNLDGVLFGYQAAAAVMLDQKRGGVILGTASVAGLSAGAGPVDYSVSKAGVVQLTRVAAHALAGTDIRVNCICRCVFPCVRETDTGAHFVSTQRTATRLPAVRSVV